MEPTLAGIAKQLHALDRSEVKAWLRRGELLTQAQELCGPAKGFTGWLRRNKISKRQAYKAIAAWRDFGAVPTVQRFTIGAMDLLSQHPAAAAEAIDRSSRDRITVKTAREILRRHVDTESPTVPHEGRPHLTHFKGEGFTITISTPHAPTTADLIGIIANASSQLREQMRLGKAAA